MIEFKVPEVPELPGGNVIVSKKVWNDVLSYIRDLQRALNNQANELVLQSQRISKVESNSAELAKALGGIYDALS